MSGITEQNIEDYVCSYKDYSSPLFIILNSAHIRIIDIYVNAFLKSISTSDPSTYENMKSQVKDLYSSAFLPKLDQSLQTFHDNYINIIKVPTRVRKYIRYVLEKEKMEMEKKLVAKELYNESYKKLLVKITKIKSLQQSTQEMLNLIEAAKQINTKNSAIINERAAKCIAYAKTVDENKGKTAQLTKLIDNRRNEDKNKKFVVRKINSDEGAVTYFMPIAEMYMQSKQSN